MADGTTQGGNEFLDDLLTTDAPVAREVEVDGKKGTVYFRRVTAGEREVMLRGQKVSTRKGEKTTIEIDLGENVKTRRQMVYFSVCRADGTKYFKRIEDVATAPSHKIDALYKVAAEVNKEEAEPDDEDGEQDQGKS